MNLVIFCCNFLLTVKFFTNAIRTILMSQPIIPAIINDATAEIATATSAYALEQLQSKYLGKNSQLVELMKSLPKLEPEARRQLGQEANKAKETIGALIKERAEQLAEAQLASILASEAIDVTLPGRGRGASTGHLHPVTQVRYDFEDFFTNMGFKIVDGPEVEDDFHNFTALNIPETHPARAQHDTFYFADGSLLRTHTSPTQIRAMREFGAPLRVITSGRVYRCDYDATHTPMFNQMEVLLVDENISFANMKWILQSFLDYFFGVGTEIRLRPSYFPFTEPSAEVDVKRIVNGKEQWLEVFGCGMVHPNVLEYGGIDSKRYSGFAFGLGLDRFAMLRYGINDLRLMFENDNEFLKQF
jgi:phenylalanyl-tRNA synthetase alpha chain